LLARFPNLANGAEYVDPMGKLRKS